MKPSALALVILSIPLALSGCKGDDAADERSRGVIGVSLLTGKNPFFITIGDNITEEAAKHGFETTVLFADEDATTQTNQIRDFIEQGVAAIVISPCETKTIAPVIKEANDAGIPVFTVDIPFLFDDEMDGRASAEDLIDDLGSEGGEVAIVHFVAADDCEQRVAGFKHIVDKHNSEEGSDVTLVATLDASEISGGNATEQLLEDHPQLKGIFFIDASTESPAAASIEAASASGIEVVTHASPDIEFAGQVATDNEPGGRQAAEAMIEALGEAGGQVAILHYEQAQSCRLRVKGFTDVINEHNETASGDIEIVSTLEGGGDRPISTAATQDLLQSQPELRGIFCINDPSALGAVTALEAAGREDIIVIGFDGQREALEAIRDGRIYADPIQYPDQMGIKIVEQIVAFSSGEEYKTMDLIPTTLYTR